MKLKKLTSFLLVFSLVFTSFALFSCGDSGDDDNGENNGEKPVTYMTITEDYTIVVPKAKRSESELVQSYLELSSALKSTFNVDATLEADTTEPGEYEIILENTNRTESSDVASAINNIDTNGYHCFRVKVIGKKIVIAGNTLMAIQHGAQWFSKQYLTTDTLGIPENLDETRYVLANDTAATPVCYTEMAIGSLAFPISIKYDDNAIADYNKNVAVYNVTLPKDSPVPVVTADQLGGTTVTIVQPTEANSYTAKITVKSKNGNTTKEYTVNFKYDPNTYPTATIEKSFGGADATVVIVHDDGSQSTANFLAQEFEKYDLRGTIGLITNKVCSIDSSGNRKINTSAVNFWQGILDTGRFIITSHSRTHTYWGRYDTGDSGYYYTSSEPATPVENNIEYDYAPGRITAEVKGSQEDIRICFPSQRAITFIKPGFGRNAEDNTQITPEATKIIQQYYVSMRNTGGGVDSIPFGNTYSVKSFMVKGGQNVNEWIGYVDEAIEKNGIIVYLFHNIDSDSGNTVSKAKASTLFKYIGEKKKEGKVWVADFEQASLYAEEYRKASVTAVQNETAITLTVTDEWEDNTLYNQALTVKLEIADATWRTVRCLYADGTGDTLTVFKDTDGNAYVYVNVVPDSGSVILYRNS